MIQPLLRWKRRWRITTLIARRAFQSPIRGLERIAIFDGGFPEERRLREFAPGDQAGLRKWAPEAIVAPLEIALWQADQHLLGLTRLAGLRAVIVLTEVGGEPLAEHYRELLWRAFGVPVFEQLRERHGAILARECEVHDGLHIDPAATVTEEMKDALISDPCDCGLETPRLRLLSFHGADRGDQIVRIGG